MFVINFGKEYLDKGSLNEHLILIHNDPMKLSRDLVCETCGFSTPSKVKLNKHVRFKHKVETHYKCPHCDYHSPKSISMHVHIDSKHQEHYKKQFFCDHCPRGFAFKNSLKKHIGNQKLMATNRAKKEMKRLKNLLEETD